MPTTTELLDKLYETALDASTGPCFECHEGRFEPGGQVPEQRHEPDGCVAYVYQTTECKACGGSGVTRPGLDHACLMGPLMAAVGLAVRSREAGNFGAMNEALDWGAQHSAQFMAASLAATGLSTLDAMEKVATAAQNGRAMLPTESPAEDGVGALSAEEIAQLEHSGTL